MRFTSQVNALVAEIVAINPLQAKFIETSLADASSEELEELDRYIRYCATNSIEVAYLAQCYDLIVKDTLREQLFFQRHHRYRYSTFAEVADAVYFDDEYMAKYMHGLAITAWLWPNHRQMHRYFATSIPRYSPGTYLEIGPGHGVYMLTAMRLSQYDRFEGIDLSPTSVEMTRALLGERKISGDAEYEVYLSDFMENALRQEQYEAIVMGEVLEHVEEPAAFLKKIHDLAAPEAFIFITTPINGPAVDHIYLFDSYAAIEELVKAAGLQVRDTLLVPYPGETVERSMEQRLAVNVALVLTR